MNKEEMIEYLRENLRIEIKEDVNYYSQSRSFEFKLILENEVISSDSIYLPRH
jgi:hypothetical protein